MLIDANLIEQLESSSCFGLAHDEKAKECKKCDLRIECSIRTADGSEMEFVKSLNNETKKALAEFHEE